MLAGLLIAAVGAALWIWTRSAQATEGEQVTDLRDRNTLIDHYAALYGVDPDLVRSFIVVESNGDALAVRNNPPTDVSVGLMQILCIPDANGNCTNRFNVDGWQGMTFDALKDEETNISIGVQILAWNLRQYGNPRGIAVYNSWSARQAPVDGPFPNDGYVKKVLAVYNRLKGYTP